MGGLNCVDATTTPSSSYKIYSHEQALDSSGEHFKDEDSDVQSFINGRSQIPRERRVQVKRKTPQPQIPIPEPFSVQSYTSSDNAKNVRKGRGNTGETVSSSDQTPSLSNMLIENSRENKALLVVADDDVKTQIKEIMKPYMLERVQQIVDRAVEDMFANVNSGEQLSYCSRQCEQRSWKVNSATSPDDSNHSDQLSNKDVELRRATLARAEVRIARGSKSAPIMITVSPPELSGSSKDGDLGSAAIRHNDIVEDFETLSTNKECITSLKLAEFPSFPLDNSDIKDMVTHGMAKSLLDADHTINKPLPVNHDQSTQEATRQVGPGEIW